MQRRHVGHPARSEKLKAEGEKSRSKVRPLHKLAQRQRVRGVSRGVGVGQDFANFLEESVWGEGLLEEGEALFEKAAAGDDIFGVARHEEHADVGARGEDASGEIAAAGAGHDHVGQEEMNFAGEFAGELLGMGGIESDKNFIALTGEDGADEVSHGFFIFD